VPGLPLALTWPGSRWLLLDASQARCRWLTDAVAALALRDRVTVRHARAEDAGREAGLRGAFDAVVARSFGSPGVTAECAAPFLAIGGRLVVSEPPDAAGERWQAGASGLEQLGLRFEGIRGEAPRFGVLVQDTACPDRYPRRPGVPSRRPLF
jgi:16S rRNA (guanine527-N7)-methyltransferase